MAPIDSYPQLNIEAALVFLAAFVVALLLSITPILDYPLYRLTVIIHELGHVVARMISGGQPEWFRVYYRSKDGARGKAFGEGGDPRLILPAGSVGLAIFSAGLVLLTGLPHHARYTLVIIAVILMLFTLRFGRELSTWLLVFGICGVFILVALTAELLWSVFLLSLLASYLSIWSIAKLVELRGIAWNNLNNPEASDDASRMAQLMGCSSVFWAEVWLVLSLLILGAAFWFTWIRNISA